MRMNKSTAPIAVHTAIRGTFSSRTDQFSNPKLNSNPPPLPFGRKPAYTAVCPESAISCKSVFSSFYFINEPIYMYKNKERRL